MTSPYAGKPASEWPKITDRLIRKHPLKSQELVDAVIEAWRLIFSESVIGGSLRIGTDLFPQPQVLGNFLHELVPLIIEKARPGEWRRDRVASEKDLVCEANADFSIEIKTSCSPKGIFGNRSFSQASQSRPAKKLKSGYYLTINFPPIHTLKKIEPIRLIRFGWLDHEDWFGQVAASGQQASLRPDVQQGKLRTIFEDLTP
jgi:hypothetical protein